MQQITDQIKKLTFVLFVDLTTAFDRVKRSWHFKSIHTVSPEYVEKIELYTQKIYGGDMETSLDIWRVV